ncbi:hypothetical protein OKW13_000973 [Bacillus velezensis]|nr:hypothetical protein [Bacillus velezensis]
MKEVIKIHKNDNVLLAMRHFKTKGSGCIQTD